MKRDDTLWKGILENICEDFIRFIFKDADLVFDIGKGFQFLDKELEQLFPAENNDAPKFVDKLIKVFSKSGSEEWILCHVEVQGYDDRDFARRMFTYFYRILDRYGKPITAIAIFTDRNKKFRPDRYDYNFLGTRNTFVFNTYKVLDQDEELLAKDSNPFAVVILTVLLALKRKSLDDESLFKLKFSLAKNLMQRKIHRQKIDDLLIFLQLYVSFADKEYNVKFERLIEELNENKKTMGIREMVLDRAEKKGLAKGIEKGLADGIEKGLETGKTAVVVNLLATDRFSTAEIASLALVTEDFVLRIKSAKA